VRVKVLTKDELLTALRQEVRLILHLASKAEPQMLDYRPTPKQRSTIELLRYFVIVGPIHMRAAMTPAFDMDGWRAAWNTEEARVKAMPVEIVKEEIGKLPALFDRMLSAASDASLRAEIDLFGTKASRGLWLVNLVLSHYTAYRMQLFLYLKASGREDLNTMNLWVGVDRA
jgi:hypothetical protein